MKKRQNLIVLIAVGLISAMLSIVISGAIFGTPQSHPIKVPVVDTISPTFPDVAHDSNYSSFLNSNALDPTQLINIGSGNNQQLFQSDQSQL